MSSRRDPAEERRRYREAKARELEAADEPAAAAAVLAGLCACGCGGRIPAGNVRAFFVDERHRKRHHRQRLERLAEAQGVPSRLSVRTLNATNGQGNRPSDAPSAQDRRESTPRPGVSVYFPNPDVLEAAINGLVRERRAANAETVPRYLERLDQALEVSRKALKRRRARVT